MIPERLETVETFRAKEQLRRADRLGEIARGRSVEELGARIERANRAARLRWEAICSARVGVVRHEQTTPAAERAKKARNITGAARFEEAQMAKKGFERIPTDLDAEIRLANARNGFAL